MKLFTFYIDKSRVLDEDNRIRLLHPVGLLLFLCLVPIFFFGYAYAFYTKAFSMVFFGTFKSRIADDIIEDFAGAVTLW